MKEHLEKSRKMKAKEELIKILRVHIELKENHEILLNFRAKEGCKELIKLHLKEKSDKLNEFLALRHYASNVQLS